MTQQPQQPGWNGQEQPGQPPQGWAGPGAPQQWGPPPQPPKKTGAGKIIGLGCLGIIGLFVLIGIIAAVAGGSDSDEGSKKPAATVGSTPKGEPGKKDDKPAEATKSQAQQFQACVAKTGTPTERAAVKHVTKVTGADKRNDVLDAAEVYTDFKGGLMSADAGQAKLIASAFTSCYKSDNGLVTVYGSDGDMMANANY
ncbi:hypothetical protein [Streptomyces sp. NBC_00566]|uniref:hypothetical protein n=1 Tax=Streptomyces sp. NBC_00566 TaxID=2975778 RepID=UPI002E81C0F5|nr:hypothetical protein [Streptomyces sp. NBC_00566]WUB88250.1 hypothetical protein OG812_17375 [Streptomyces sp. NBC_00566]